MTELFVDKELVTTPLNRIDLSLSKVEGDFVFNLDDSKDDNRFINNNEIENEILVDYCDFEEDLQIEKDTNIDE